MGMLDQIGLNPGDAIDKSQGRPGFDVAQRPEPPGLAETLDLDRHHTFTPLPRSIGQATGLVGGHIDVSPIQTILDEHKHEQQMVVDGTRWLFNWQKPGPALASGAIAAYRVQGPLAFRLGVGAVVTGSVYNFTNSLSKGKE